MIHGTAVVWLPVTDVQRSLAFYRDTLGLEEVRAADGWAELDANGLHIGLNATESPSGGGGGVIAFQPEGGLDAAVEQLRGDGVEIAGEISEHPWGRVATFKDPDGNDLQLYEPPGE
jgi:catechol 2,3-dioxygenase-like lactoylglutathione lyase family enzyme